MKLVQMISIVLLSYTFANAADSMPSRDEIDAALQECFQSVSTDNNGRPDHDAVDACMSKKGYEKPQGKPGDKQNGERPPMR